MAKEKKVAYQLIRPDSPNGAVMYPMLGDLITRHHDHLVNARIALAWNTAWTADVDGRQKLGQCKKASDLDRELADYDFVILLWRDFYEDTRVTNQQREALMDHELSHAQVKLDKEGYPERDERGRTVYRLRKHDIEEFSDVVARHGLYKRDLEIFAKAIQVGQRQRTLPREDEGDGARVAANPAVREAVRNLAPAAGSGIDSVTITTNIPGQGERSVTLTQEDRKRLDAQRSRPS